jgi:RNA recognition motif-containing protein
VPRLSARERGTVPAGLTHTGAGWATSMDRKPIGALRMTKIYVGNLPFSATEEEIRRLFTQHGTVNSVNLVMDRDTGRPRGFGFVEMPAADASRAIKTLNGTDLGGRALRVNEAQERMSASGRG